MRFGQFDDIKSNKRGQKEISIKCKCRPLEDQRESNRFQRSYSKLTFREICFDISFSLATSSASKDLAQLRPQLISSRVSCEYRETDDNTNRLNPWKESFFGYTDTQDENYQESYISIKRPAKFTDETNKELSRRYRDAFGCTIDMDERSENELQNEYFMATIEGCIMRHFIPEYILCNVDAIKDRSFHMTYIIFTAFDQLKSQRKIDDDLLTYSNQIREVMSEIFDEQISMEEILKDEESVEFLDTTSVEKIEKVLDTLRSISYQQIYNIVHKKILDSVDGSQESFFQASLILPDKIRCATSYLDNIFSSSFRYLGPLRDAPKSLYPLSLTDEPDDIGLRGEHTAFILELHKKTKVNYIPSSHFTDEGVSTTFVNDTLENALSDWLRYLGIAESVKSVTSGKQGYKVEVETTNSDEMHELNHVGVGVSQVLPILVMGLISRPDSTLVFEQPELHLHPRVQSLLADFFLSITLSNRQCLVETHSEHLLNRLRYRIATMESGNNLNEIIKIYFAEKGQNGSSFNGVEINEYGSIRNWPNGFFDQTQQDIQRLLDAASRKGKRKRRHRDG